MLELANSITTPTGGFVYRDERTGITHRDISLAAIFVKVASSRSANDIELASDWKEQIVHEICVQSNLECREAGEPERHLTIADVRRFASTATEWLAQGGGFVDSAESERRATICRTCQENKRFKICFGCSATLSWLGERMNWPQTKQDDHLHGCLKCACLLKLKVHMPLGVIDSHGINWPSHCWMKDSQA